MIYLQSATANFSLKRHGKNNICVFVVKESYIIVEWSSYYVMYIMDWMLCKFIVWKIIINNIFWYNIKYIEIIILINFVCGIMRRKFRGHVIRRHFFILCDRALCLWQFWCAVERWTQNRWRFKFRSVEKLLTRPF